ncbi:MAG: SIS domain-containing protein, partial [Burkholderiales bacterium]
MTQFTSSSSFTHDFSHYPQEIQSAFRVLHQEIAGLQALSEVLDHRFLKAIALIRACKGRVIVSGMGKSGHIARKMAATFASTGTPSFFVHPGEASHGDLGMITPNDIVMLLSNSGETPELQDIIRYSKR